MAVDGGKTGGRAPVRLRHSALSSVTLGVLIATVPAGWSATESMTGAESPEPSAAPAAELAALAQPRLALPIATPIALPVAAPATASEPAPAPLAVPAPRIEPATLEPIARETAPAPSESDTQFAPPSAAETVTPGLVTAELALADTRGQTDGSKVLEWDRPVSTPISDQNPQVTPQNPAISAPLPVSAPTAELIAPAPALLPGAARFDLAALPAKAPAAQASIPAAVPAKSRLATPQRRAPAGIGVAGRPVPRAPGGRYKVTPRGLEFDIAVLVAGEPGGRVPLLIDATDSLSVRLADMLGAVRPLMDEATFARLSASGAAQDYVSFSTLRRAGIDLRYDAAHDRLLLTTALGDD